MIFIMLSTVFRETELSSGMIIQVWGLFQEIIFFSLLLSHKDRSYWNFYLVLYFLNKTTLGCKIAKAFEIFYYLLNCCSLKCLTKKAWNFPLHCSWKRNINSQKCSLIKLTNATWGSFFIPQETKVLIWSIFSNTICSKMTKQLCFLCSS